MTRTSIETHPTGTHFDFTNPTPEMVHIEDIARALSQTARFGGHTRKFYSVAEHALLVHRLVRHVAGPELAFAALHHDSHEAYLGDIPTPLKRMLGAAFVNLATEIDFAIGAQFDIDPNLFDHDIIKAADAQALAIEAGVLKKSGGLGPHWPATHMYRPDVPTGAAACVEPAWAEGLFLDAHRVARAKMLAERRAA